MEEYIMIEREPTHTSQIQIMALSVYTMCSARTFYTSP